jgi:hypothetical protein
MIYETQTCFTIIYMFGFFDKLWWCENREKKFNNHLKIKKKATKRIVIIT